MFAHFWMKSKPQWCESKGNSCKIAHVLMGIKISYKKKRLFSSLAKVITNTLFVIDWPMCGIQMLPQCIMSNIYCLSMKEGQIFNIKFGYINSDIVQYMMLC
jgi:hypothetical protein